MNRFNINAIDKQKIRDSFNRAASIYDEQACWQKKAGTELLELLAQENLHPNHIADMGCGTGYIIQSLIKRYPEAQHCAIDIAENMLTILHQQQPTLSLVHADIDQLPLPTQTFDLVMSNLALQWCTQLDSTLQEISRVLTNNGWFFFTTLGPNTLNEAREVSQQFNFEFPANSFNDLSTLHQSLIKNNLAPLQIFSKPIEMDYHSLYDLMKHLKQVGSYYPTQQKGLMGHHKLQQIFNTPIRVTYEIIFVISRKI